MTPKTDLDSPVQRGVAFGAAMLALFEIAYCWLVSSLIAAAPGARLTAMTIGLLSIVVANGVLMFGREYSIRHWLRILSLASIALMIVGPAVVVLFVLVQNGR